MTQEATASMMGAVEVKVPINGVSVKALYKRPDASVCGGNGDGLSRLHRLSVRGMVGRGKTEKAALDDLVRKLGRANKLPRV